MSRKSAKDIVIEDLEERLQESLDRADYFESCIETFFTGDIPEEASLNHMILASWGRKRLESLKKTPVLLQKEVVG